VGAPPAASRADVLLGEWWTEAREGRVRFTRASDGTFRGTTTCCIPDKPSPERPAQDIHNPDPKQRGRSTVGIVIIWKLVYEDGEYSGGYVYNPRDGKTYRFAVEIVNDGTIEVRGYVGIPLLGQSQIWKRALGPGRRGQGERNTSVAPGATRTMR
jgi:uncharacterized protein (DUF2147 family)